MVDNCGMFAAKHNTTTDNATVKAAIRGKPSKVSGEISVSIKAVAQAMTTPKILQVMFLQMAALSAPSRKKTAQGMVAAQMKNSPLAGPTAKNVAAPAKPPILKDSAVSLSTRILHYSPQAIKIAGFMPRQCHERQREEDDTSLFAS